MYRSVNREYYILGLDLYGGWHSIILYPDEFRAPFEFADPAGVVHQGSRDLSGEAWHRGPV
ncbi:MAG: zinc-dependent peptidase, partial [Bacteroidota bacterium]